MRQGHWDSRKLAAIVIAYPVKTYLAVYITGGKFF